MSLIHSSTRRPRPLTQKDYDHEIFLRDNTRRRSQSSVSRRTRSQSVLVSPSQQDSLPPSESSSRRHSDAFLQPKHRRGLRDSVRERRYSRHYSKWQKSDRQSQGEKGIPPADVEGDASAAEVSTAANADRHCEASPERGRLRTPKNSKPDSNSNPPEPQIDVLYENQRGGILCGLALFSANALGFLDTAPWTNIANKTSATNITNAQCPDPSWQWSWKEWSVNKTEEVDEDGWEYAFAFGKAWAWQSKGRWWKSCVRRRAWIRQRVKRNEGYHRAQEAHMLNDDYFTIHSRVDARSVSRAATSRGRSPGHRKESSRYSVAQPMDLGEEIELDDIRDVRTLMAALKFSRIDREKTEAVESFIKNGGDELCYLREKMHDIMGMFIFQASRRLLLSHLITIMDEATEVERKALSKSDINDDEKKTKRRRLENLKKAVEAADEQVKRLEFWSDVKEMVVQGETKGASSPSQGWGREWFGLDDSGPHDVLHGRGDCGETAEMVIDGLHSGSEERLANGSELEELRNGLGKGKGKRKGKGKGDGQVDRKGKGVERDGG